jgi:integrase
MQRQSSTGRRSYGTGSLYIRRDGNGRETWYGRWRVGDRRVNRRVGPKRHVASSDGLTLSQAERELRRLMESEISVPITARMTLVQAGERYCDHAEAKGRKRSTVMDYRSAVRTHFASFTKPLEAITPADVERFMRDQQRKGRSAKSIRNWVGILSATFNYARRQGWCSSNPCGSVELPRVDASDDTRFLSAEELTALLRATGGNGRFAETDRVLYLTAAMTGMRQGELLALRWQDVDWTASKIRVRQNYVRGEYGSPKTRRSTRSTPMADTLGAELERHFQRSDWQGDQDLVFPNPDTGQPLGRTKLTKRYKDALERAGVREVRFHDLRHTFGTAMASSGVPMKALQEWLGHRDSRTTDRYADYAPGQREAEMVDRAFSSVHSSVQTEQNSDDLTSREAA